MFFAFPYYLFGLILIGVPIALHLFNLQRANKMKFSSLLFVKQVKESDLKRLKLKDLVLLILRVLFILSIVLAFSGLHIRPSKIIPGNEKSKTAVVIDDSYSMGFDDMINKQYSLTDELLRDNSNANDFKVYRTSEILTGDKISDTSKNRLSLLIADYSSIFSRLKEKPGNVILFTDRQSVNFENKINSGGENIILFDISDKKPANIGISSVRTETDIYDKSAAQIFYVKIKNFNDFDVDNLNVSFSANGIPAGNLSAVIKAGEEKELPFTIQPQSEDYLNVKVSITSDEKSDNFKEDDEAYFSINFGNTINAAVIGGSGGGNKYLLASIKSLQETGNKVTTQVINGFENLNKYDAILIYDDFLMNDNDIRQLSSFVNSGKGVFVFLTMKSDLSSLNKFLGENMNSISVNGIVKPDSSLTQADIDINHPIYSGIFNKGKNEFYFGAVKNIYSVTMNQNSYSLMKLKNSFPVIIETKTNSGRLLISTLSPDETMSSFVRNDIFAPLINRGIFYLTSNAFAGAYNQAGKNNFIKISGSGENLTVTNPHGLKQNIHLPFSDNSKRFFNIPVSDFYLQKGIYSLADSSGKTSEYFSMNADFKEGNVLSLGEKDIKNYFSENGFSNVNIVRTVKDAGEILSSVRKGTDLTSLFLILGIIFLLSEIIYNLTFNKFGRK